MIEFKQWLQENIENIEVIKTEPENRNPDFDDEITFRLGNNILKVVKNPLAPTDWSVSETFVEEASRRQGIASRLIDKMLSTLEGNIGAQCSSDGSVRLFWKKGFRIDGTLEDAIEKRREWSSVNLIHP
jgi:predicted GNAT family acetyltransferase